MVNYNKNHDVNALTQLLNCDKKEKGGGNMKYKLNREFVFSFTVDFDYK